MGAIKELSLLALEAKRNQYPSVPEYALPKPQYSDKTANGLTTCIIDYLRIQGFYAVRINIQGQFREDIGKWTKGSTSRRTADIHACINGKHLSIEIKIGKDIQSIYQKETQAQIEAAGGLYVIAKDFESFYEWLNAKKKGGAI